MTQKKSSNEDAPKVEEPKEEIEVVIEGDSPEPVKDKVEKEKVDAPNGAPKQDDDVLALKKRVEELNKAQEIAAMRALEAERRSQEYQNQVNSFRQSAEQSQYDTIVTAMGAAQIEVDTAKRDIMLAGAAQDYSALADAQERLAAAKAHMIGLEQSKQSYEYQRERGGQVQQQQQNNGLLAEEQNWLARHPEVMSDLRKNTKLNAAYYDAMDKGIQRGTPEYFQFIEEQLGYRQPMAQDKREEPEESPVMVAAPPSKSVPSGSGSGGRTKGSYTLSKEEAEIARISGITPQEYVIQRERLRELKKANPGDYPSGYGDR